MSEKTMKQYLFVSDFDQTLTFNDSGYVLSEIVGIPTGEFLSARFPVRTVWALIIGGYGVVVASQRLVRAGPNSGKSLTRE